MAAQPAEKLLYRSPFVLPARLLLRMKVLQVGTLVGMGAPAVIAARAGELMASDYAILGSTFAGSMVVGGSLAFIAERFIGEIRLRPESRSVVSTLSICSPSVTGHERGLGRARVPWAGCSLRRSSRLLAVDSSTVFGLSSVS
jgi:hypothetical protein